MIVLRAAGVLVAGLLAVAAVLGFAAQRTLDRPELFTADMTAALDDPAVNAELKREVRQEARNALDRLAASGGTLADLAASLGADTIADQAAAVVDTAVFRSAWRDWSALIFTGLAARAQGRSDPDVVVGQRSLTIAVAPLLGPVFGEGLAGEAVPLLDFLAPDATVTIDTTAPIGPLLDAVGQLAQWRWALLIAAVTIALLVVLSRRWAGWGATVLLWTAVLCAAGAGLVRVAQQQPVPGSDYPQLGLAIVAAATGSWDELLLTVAGACLAGAGILLIIAVVTRRRPAPATP